jgi:alanine racemase
VAHIPLRLRIDGEALVSNWRWLAERSGDAACGAAVKANGYGLGAVEAVKRLAAAGCRDFFVATWAEAETLMPWADGLHLSVLHGVGPDDLADAKASPARPVLNTMEQVARWRQGGEGRPCDLMVDTGMNRLGLTPDEARTAIGDGLQIDTLMSHLACADEPDHPMNEQQLHRFQQLRRELPAERYSLANSAGICLGPKYCFGLTRPGLAIYGGLPVPGDSIQENNLRPVVSVEAQLVQIRDVPAGGSVGYGATYVTGEPTRVGVLNVGYADGVLRLLGPKTFIRKDDRSFVAVGRVSMDLVAVDLDGAKESQNIAGRSGGLVDAWTEPLPRLSFEEGEWLLIDYDLVRLSDETGLSQYELLTNLGSRFERVWS